MTAARRNVTAASEISRSQELPEAARHLIEGLGDPLQRFQLRRLCPCAACEGSGKQAAASSKGGSPVFSRCSDCRGEGRTLELVATAATPEAVGVALVELGREGEWAECPVGILDTEGEKGQKWIVLPWLPSPRNVSDAGRVLRAARD